jgi:hemolysin activation/secretion protein
MRGASWAAASLAIASLGAGGAFGQAIERNLPPPPAAAAPGIPAPGAAPATEDATPIGPALRAIVLLGPRDAAEPTPADGIDVSRIPRLADSRGAFSRFLGRRLSRRLIAAVEAEVTRRYRAKGFPFVAISTPPQEVTSGVLQLRVVEFHLGAKTAPGAPPRVAPYVESRVRVGRGEAIDAGQLAQDLDWLDRFPFRRSAAVFTPGTDVGDTDLRLQTTSSKPWSVYLGYANSGSPLTGWDRYFAGAQTVVPGLRDAVVSFQFTGSGDVLFGDGRVFSTAPDPRYVSDAGRLIVPTLPRQDLEAAISFVQSNQASPDFLTRQTTYEASLAYRSALSNLWPVLPGEAAAGVELKRQASETLFGGSQVAGATFDVFQITLAYAQQESDAFGRASGDVTVHISPGRADHLNTAAAFDAAANGQRSDASYVYVSADLSRYTRLPTLFGLSGWGLANSLMGQYAAVPLPLTERIGLGGASLVRAYTLDDGVYDAGLVSRNELRAPGSALLGRSGFAAAADQLSPFVFVDAGLGKDRRTGATSAPVSTGLGADYQMGAHLSATLVGAWALGSVGMTRRGEARVDSRVTLTF